MGMQQRQLAVPAGLAPEELATVQREFVHLAFQRLRVDRAVTADEVEEAVRRLDAGELDDMIAAAAPQQEAPAAPERYADLKPFDYRAWRARHGVKD